MWALDGDLLHLKWKQSTTKVAPGADDTVTDQDAVVEEDNTAAYTYWLAKMLACTSLELVQRRMRSMRAKCLNI